MNTVEFLARFWQDIVGWLLLLEIPLTIGTLVWVMHVKRDSMSAIAWCLAVVLLPFIGPLLYFLFGYQTVQRPLKKRKQSRKKYQALKLAKVINAAGTVEQVPIAVPTRWSVLEKLAHHPEGFPVTAGNHITLYHQGRPAYDAMLETIRNAKHHIHIEFFIFRPDNSGREFVEALATAARRGIEVRFLYDSVGSYSLSSRLLAELRSAGAKAVAFLPLLNPFHRLRVNLRNHRKILIVDGTVAFTGGLNIGDEYLGLDPGFGAWRDTHFRLEGAAVESLQRVFLEDWYFAANEVASGENYTPREFNAIGKSLIQIVHSGPDIEYKSIRETYFAGILRGRKRVWIASPYFVPDAGILDALILAGRAGVDVRMLGLFRPDKWLPFLAARFYWAELLAAGVKVYQYTAGMMHAKYMLVDSEWASVGTANMDNRSLHLNFEVNCLVYDEAVVHDLEAQYLVDLSHAVLIDPKIYDDRPAVSKMAENLARLFSPIL